MLGKEKASKPLVQAQLPSPAHPLPSSKFWELLPWLDWAKEPRRWSQVPGAADQGHPSQRLKVYRRLNLLRRKHNRLPRRPTIESDRSLRLLTRTTTGYLALNTDTSIHARRKLRLDRVWPHQSGVFFWKNCSSSDDAPRQLERQQQTQPSTCQARRSVW